MISLGARLVNAAVRLMTLRARRRHMSLSRSVKFKEKPYSPPRGYAYSVRKFNGTDVEVLTPPRASEDCIIVQFHGGGHTQPMNSLYRKVAERYAALSGCAVYSIDYHTGENLVFPSVHEECLGAYRGIAENARGKKIIAAGDSMGVNHMLYACLRLRDEGQPLPVALVSASCYIDLAASGKSYDENCHSDPLYGLPIWQKKEKYGAFLRRKTPYAGSTDERNCLLSPAYADLKGLPPMLILCGAAETSASDSDMLYDGAVRGKVRARLIKYGGMFHDFFYFVPFIRESRAAWRETERFLAEILSPQCGA